MKTIVILAGLVISLTSCKKEIQCNCEVKTEFRDSNGKVTSDKWHNEKRVVKNTTKNKVRQGACSEVDNTTYSEQGSVKTKTHCEIDFIFS